MTVQVYFRKRRSGIEQDQYRPLPQAFDGDKHYDEAAGYAEQLERENPQNEYTVGPGLTDVPNARWEASVGIVDLDVPR